METKPIDQKEILLLAADNIDGVLYAVDRNLVFTLSKGRKSSLLGLDPGKVIGTSMYDYLETADPSHQQISLHLRALKGETVVIDTSHQSTDLRTTISPLTSADGKIVGALGLVLDITERKRSEDALQESERSYRQLFSHMPTGLYEVDFINGRFTKVNSSICSYTGYSEEELLTMSPFNILTKESQNLFQNRLEQMFRGETVSTNPEFCILNKDGSTRWVQLNSEFIKCDGVTTGARVVVHDITERKRTEDALREKEIKMSSLLDNMTDVVWSVTLPDMATQYVSPSAEKVFGYPEKAFYEDPNFWKKISHPDDQHLIEKAMSELFEKGTATRECRTIRPDGSVAWVLDRSKLIMDENGVPIKVEGQTQDITKRKQAETALQRQLEEKEILLKETHHRIKNNITSIASLLSIQSRSIENPEASSILTQAIGRVKSIATLYEKMLLSDEFKEVHVATYLGDLADSVIALFCGKPTVTLEKRFDDFQIDSKMAFSLGIIVNELLTNVMKYAFVDRKTGRVSLIATQKNKQMTLIVRDDGNGLPQGFDSESNHGFGFVLVKMLSQQLDGLFTITSSAGTVCTLEIPLQKTIETR